MRDNSGPSNPPTRTERLTVVMPEPCGECGSYGHPCACPEEDYAVRTPEEVEAMEQRERDAEDGIGLDGGPADEGEREAESSAIAREMVQAAPIPPATPGVVYVPALPVTASRAAMQAQRVVTEAARATGYQVVRLPRGNNGGRVA